MSELLKLKNKYNIDYSLNLVDEQFIDEMEKFLCVKIGRELREYILEFGHIEYEYIEFLGVNSLEKMNSDMVKLTVRLHENHEKTKSFVALESIGDSIYTLINADDSVYCYDAVLDDFPIFTGKKLSAYIEEKIKNA